MRHLKKYAICRIFMAMSIMAASGAGEAAERWLGVWACSQQLTEPHNMPPEPGLSGNTLRQVARVTLGGGCIRLWFSNEYGKGPVAIASAHVAVSLGGGAVDPRTERALSFKGSPSLVIPPGKTAVSDAVDFDLAVAADVAVSLYFGEVPPDLTGHPGSRATSYIKTGDASGDHAMSGAVTTDHWYILGCIETLADSSRSVLVAAGDSLTDGRGSTTNGNDRWPDNLFRRLQADKRTKGIAVLNMGVGGNAAVSGGLGPTLSERFGRDVLERGGVRWVILLEGVNDIGGSKDVSVADALISAYKDFAVRAHAKGIRVYASPILPFGGSQYDTEAHEAARRKVNAWISTGGAFDEVIDLDAVVRDPADPARLLPAYDTGDHLHLNQAGYRAMADAMDLELFR